jgi:hypothetical protein
MDFETPRELLLVGVARRCRECDEPAQLGLTKAEARDYRGFECGRCESWNDDDLSEQDIPEWWDELRRAAAAGPPRPAAAQGEGGAGVVAGPGGGRRRGLSLVAGGGGRADGEDS